MILFDFGMFSARQFETRRGVKLSSKTSLTTVSLSIKLIRYFQSCLRKIFALYMHLNVSRKRPITGAKRFQLNFTEVTKQWQKRNLNIKDNCEIFLVNKRDLFKYYPVY